jgi:iron-sulfur cluster insertion protein
MNAVSEVVMPEPLVFTDNAAAKVRQLIDEEGNTELKLRVFVTGGGCSGFQYGFTFDETVNDDDTSLNKGGVTLLIDPMSLQYLTGAEIDYQENVEGAQFVIKNPNASSTCGCGSSFSESGWVDRPQYAKSTCTGDPGQVAGFARDCACRQPRKCSRFYGFSGNTEVVGERNAASR